MCNSHCTFICSLRAIFFQLQDTVWQIAFFLLDKTQFCRTVLYDIIVIMVIFVGQLSDRIRYFVSQNEILLVLTDRPALFVKIVFVNCFVLCMKCAMANLGLHCFVEKQNFLVVYTVLSQVNKKSGLI